VQTCPELIEQSLMVSHELIRVAILWHEQWHEGLEEASRMCASHHISCDSAFPMMALSFAAAFVRTVRTVASDYSCAKSSYLPARRHGWVIAGTLRSTTSRGCSPRCGLCTR
jgi:hypothetical protein